MDGVNFLKFLWVIMVSGLIVFGIYQINLSIQSIANKEAIIMEIDVEDERTTGYVAGIIDARDIVNQKIIQLDELPDENEKHYQKLALRGISKELSSILDGK